jgi:phosphoglycerate dehydrogenase-like enzyme
MHKPLRIWCNYKLPAPLALELERSLGENKLVWSQFLDPSNLVASGADPMLERVDVAFGQPDPDQVIQLPSIKWVHLTSAGYTRYDRDDLREAMQARGGKLTNSSAVFAEPCAQHVLAFMLTSARGLYSAWTNQSQERNWPTALLRRRSHLLSGQRVLILGFGAIARKLVDYLRPLEVEIIAVRRHVRGNESVPIVAVDRVDELIPDADHIVNILPANLSTTGFIDATRLAMMKPSAMFYNIGRGDTVDQSALIDALTANRLAGAYLDVTSPEPLPPEHPLWTTPHCHITPHSAGGHADEIERVVAHFLTNLQRFIAGTELRDRVM